MGAVVAVAGFAARALLGLVADPQGHTLSTAELWIGHGVSSSAVASSQFAYGDRSSSVAQTVVTYARPSTRRRRSLSRWAASATGTLGFPAPSARSAMVSSEMVARQIRTE